MVLVLGTEHQSHRNHFLDFLKVLYIVCAFDRFIIDEPCINKDQWCHKQSILSSIQTVHLLRITRKRKNESRNIVSSKVGASLKDPRCGMAGALADELHDDLVNDANATTLTVVSSPQQPQQHTNNNNSDETNGAVIREQSKQGF